MSCPASETLERLALGFLEDDKPVRKHVAACGDCSARMKALAEEHAVWAQAARAVKLPRIAPRRAVWKPLSIAAALLLATVGGAVMVHRSAAPEPVVARSLVEREVPAKATSPAAPNRGVETYSVADLSVAAAPPSRAGMFFRSYGVNPVVDTAQETLSTFALDVDTASYSIARNYLKRGQLPPPEAVRVEEFVNYFKYIDSPPVTGTFGVCLEAAPSPFDTAHHLLRIALKAKTIPEKERKDLVLTFVIDVSGSMNQENRLELVKRSLEFLVGKLRPTDRIGIVTYTDYARKLLDPTPISRKAVILAVLGDLAPLQSTNADAGLRMGYELADAGFDPKATNRVVLCTDGVANTGATGPEAILAHIKERATKGIYLSALGFGMGNYNDVLLEKLADGGNGNYAYIDDFAEAKKIFTEKLMGMMEVVAADTKVQAEFDPATVATFRLVGYEDRHVENKDFRNDKVDAGEVGAGHQVTALYEIALKPKAEGRLVTVRIRFREPASKEVLEEQWSIGVPQVARSLKDASPSYRLATAVMEFAEILRASGGARGITLDQVLEAAQGALVEMDKPADVVEFVELVKAAKVLKK